MRKGLEEVYTEFQSANPNQLEVKTWIAGDGADGIKNQVKQFEEVIAWKPQLIIVQPTDNARLSDGLKAANRAKIPVIAFDQYITGGKLAAYVTSDNYQAGELNAEYIDSLFPPEKSLKIVIFEYPRVSSTIERVDGFLDTLRSLHREFKILRRYEAVEPVGGKKAALDFLNDYPEKGSVDVIFTVNDGGGTAIVSELVKSGRTEIVHATVDGAPDSVKNITSGKLTAVNSAQFCAELGRQSMRLGLAKLSGKEIPKKLFVPTFPITKETLHLYQGWLGKMPSEFDKKWGKGGSKRWKPEFKQK